MCTPMSSPRTSHSSGWSAPDFLAMTTHVGLASGLAEAQPDFGTFVAHFPASGPWTWCPGQDMTGLHTDTGRGGPARSCSGT
jgi:hypothetical protein